jgi:hypothetical protein
MTNDFQNQQNQPQQTVYVTQIQKKSNGMGTAGFVLALVALFFGWIPVLGWVMWLLGLIFSFIGVFRSPKGLAIAGLVISLIDVIVIIVLFGVIMGSAHEFSRMHF